MLTIELDVESVVTQVAAHLHITPPTFGGWTRAKRGYARYSTGKFVLPESLLRNFNPDYVLYYITHEVVHFAAIGEHHGKEFKRLERRALKLFGLTPKYGVAYPRMLLDEQGQAVYVKPVRRRPVRHIFDYARLDKP